ncbi:hypothetical protein NHX12_011284, partial [Muraenolepis orangiensis]
MGLVLVGELGLVLVGELGLVLVGELGLVLVGELCLVLVEELVRSGGGMCLGTDEEMSGGEDAAGSSLPKGSPLTESVGELGVDGEGVDGGGWDRPCLRDQPCLREVQVRSRFRVRVQGPGPGSWSRVLVQGPGSGSQSRVPVLVAMELTCTLCLTGPLLCLGAAEDLLGVPGLQLSARRRGESYECVGVLIPVVSVAGQGAGEADRQSDVLA